MGRNAKTSLTATVHREKASTERLAEQRNEPGAPRSAEKLELLLELAIADYKYLTTDLRAFQYSQIRTYLWLSVTLLAFSSILFLNLLEQNNPVSFLHGAPSLGFYSFAVMTFFNQLSVFVIGVDSLQSRDNRILPINAYDLELEPTWDEHEKDYENALRNTLANYQQGIVSEVNKRTKMKATIKDMSRLLIISVCLAITTVGIYAMTPA